MDGALNVIKLRRLEPHVVEDVADHDVGVSRIHHDPVRQGEERQVVAIVQLSERPLIATGHVLQKHAIRGGTSPRVRLRHRQSLDVWVVLPAR